jgi:hypothetical protein
MKDRSKAMIVTAWNNGAHHASGAGYGLKIGARDRKHYFKKEWHYIVLELEENVDPVIINIKKQSFWSKACGELINIQIGQWFKEKGIALWPRGFPPKLILEPISGNRFRVKISDIKTP